ncbi:MAG: preprotein translocase subunit YajC [Streptosporangiaceae bacterium]|jgi:preprotein translocase subunit YajC
MGILAAADAASRSSSSSLTFPILIVLVFVGFYFLMIRPQRRRQQQVAQQQNTVVPGARVRTTAGMYATVVAVEDNDVILEVAPGVEVRYLKRAIMEVVTPAEAEDGDTFEDGETFEDTGAYSDDEPASDVDDDETPGTHGLVNGVGSGDEGFTDAHEGELATSDKDNAH